MTIVAQENQSYSRMSAWQARAVLLCAMAFFGLGLMMSPAPQAVYAEKEHPTSDDVLLYLAEIDRMRAGEDYYKVAADELVARGFPTRSVFNWRTPLPLQIIALMPSSTGGRLILVTATVILLLLAVKAASTEDSQFNRFALPLSILLTAPLLQCFSGNLFVMSEIWAGVAIGLSIAFYGMEKWCFAALIGLAALFLRDLSLPYCIACLGLSIWQRRRSESLVWAVGLAAWSIYYAHHCWTVSALIDSNAISHQHGWIRFGGLTFLLATVQVNYFLLAVPMPVTVAYLTLALLGLCSNRSSWCRRTALMTMIYLAAFCVVGQDFNRYWGFLMTPLLCFGVARSPIAILDLMKAARWFPLTNRSDSANVRCIAAPG